MALAVRAEVVLVPLKNCLVNLPPGLIALLSSTDTPPQDVVVQLQYRSQVLSPSAVSSGNTSGFMRSAYVGWTGMPTRARHTTAINSDRARAGLREQESQAVEIDSVFAKLLGLTEGQKVGILLHVDPPVAHTINIEPLTPADWEVIELHATFLELNLLSQIRALPNPSFSATGAVNAENIHPLTLHLSPTATANIIVTSFLPPIPTTSPFAKISPDAEVIVAPKTRARANRNTRGETRSVASRRSGKSGVSNTRGSSSRKSVTTSALYLRAFDYAASPDFADPAHQTGHNNGLQIWLAKDLIESEALSGVPWATVSLVKPAGLRAQLEQGQLQQLKEEESSDAGRPTSKLVASIATWTTPLDHNHVVLSSRLSELIGVPGLVGGIVRVEAAQTPLPRPAFKSFHFFPFLPSTTKKKEGLRFGGESRNAKQALIDRLRLAHGGENGLLAGPLTDGMILPPSGDPTSSSACDGGILRFDPAGSKDGDSAKSLQWVIGREHKHEFEIRNEIPHPTEWSILFPTFIHGLPDQLPELVGSDQLIKQCMSNLTLCSSVLLTGGIGSGKTSIAQFLGLRLREDYLFNVTYFSCQKLVTDETRVSTVKETLTRLFMSASWCARLGGQAIVILDDLDKICPAETELQVGNDNGRSRQITEIFCSVIRRYCSIHSGVAVLAVAQSKDSLNNIIIGGHIVGDIISIKSPAKEVRRDILHKLVSNIHDSNGKNAQSRSFGHSRHASHNAHDTPEDSWMDPSNPSSRPASAASSHQDGFQVAPNLDLLEVAGKTDGYMPADLVLLVSRARNECLIRSISDLDSNEHSLLLAKADFDAALRNFTPSSLRNVTLTKSSTSFSSIGGLHATRNTLLETLFYPTKYAPIFARSPLRLRSGLLLYGYPGCGKTLLASAVAGECNLNFISVKGPEILNKYIGASEKSVRDLFERAQAAKPCVLFFDEFDSIAPKRGHDSTGVTDRVVNQMLTQMDGAEGLDGVYVLAATSRPDLIDPALLRPGRLDKSLLCDMPDTSDRHDILKAVSTKLELAPEVENRLLTVAEKTEGFSGADLQALMYNAHLEAIHDLLNDRTNDDTSTTSSAAINRRNNSSSNAHARPGRPSYTRRGSSQQNANDILEFIFSAEEDAQHQKTVTPSTQATSRAAIHAKLEEMKTARKREKELQKNQALPADQRTYASRGFSMGENGTNAITNGTEGEKADKKNEVIIQWSHIMKSLGTTRSSISAQERRRLKAIYDEFVTGRNGEMPSGQGPRDVGGRSSLM